MKKFYQPSAELMAEDAEQWGKALNEAGWELLDALIDVGVDTSEPRFFNNIKPCLRRAILKYLEEVKKNG